MATWGGAWPANARDSSCVDNCLSACIRLVGYESSVLQVLELHGAMLESRDSHAVGRARSLQHRRLSFYLGRLVNLGGQFRYNTYEDFGSSRMGGYVTANTNNGAALK